MPLNWTCILSHVAAAADDAASAKSLQSCLTLVTPWTVACQAPLSMGFSRQEYWSGLPFPPPGDLPDPGMELVSPASPALAGGFFTTELPGNPWHISVSSFSNSLA